MIKAVSFRLLLGICSGVIIAALLLGFVSSRYYPISTNSSDLEYGGLVFKAKCSGCHSVESGKQIKMGPSLALIGVEAQSRKPGLSAAEFILESIIDPDAHVEPSVEGSMPAGTTAGSSEQELRNLVAFLASRGADPDYSNIVSLNFKQITPEAKPEEIPSVATLKHGWFLFKDKLGCANCHSILGEPGSGLMFPSLSMVSNLSTDYIIESIREPDKYITLGYQQFSAKTSAGASIAGRLLRENETTVEIMFKNEHEVYERLTVEKKELSDFRLSEKSLMPPFELNPEDEKALVSLLKFLQSKVD